MRGIKKNNPVIFFCQSLKLFSIIIIKINIFKPCIDVRLMIKNGVESIW